LTLFHLKTNVLYLRGAGAFTNKWSLFPNIALKAGGEAPRFEGYPEMVEKHLSFLFRRFRSIPLTRAEDRIKVGIVGLMKLIYNQQTWWNAAVAAGGDQLGRVERFPPGLRDRRRHKQLFGILRNSGAREFAGGIFPFCRAAWPWRAAQTLVCH